MVRHVDGCEQLPIWQRAGHLGSMRRVSAHVDKHPAASRFGLAVGDFVQHVRSLGVSLGQILEQCAMRGSLGG